MELVCEFKCYHKQKIQTKGENVQIESICSIVYLKFSSIYSLLRRTPPVIQLLAPSLQHVKWVIVGIITQHSYLLCNTHTYPATGVIQFLAPPLQHASG
jgi:hypothetical protein